eukprot:6043773-Amphidinium_carterae.1
MMKMILKAQPPGIETSNGERPNTVTKEDEIKFKNDVLQGKCEEIGAHVKHKVFQRSRKKDTVNIIDGAWVLKWKWKSSATRHYRARLCLRGFKDSQKAELDAFANTTATTTTKRIICSCAALFNWKLTAADVPTAFLQGFEVRRSRLSHSLESGCRDHRITAGAAWLRGL